MPQLLGLIFVGAVAWAGYRWFQRALDRVQADLRDADDALQRRADEPVGTLEKDPETGVYKPVDRAGR